MVDVILHVIGALGMQAGGALLGYLFGVPSDQRIIWCAVGSVIAGAGSAVFWWRREVRQAGGRRPVHTVEWVAPAIANAAGVIAFPIVARFL